MACTFQNCPKRSQREILWALRCPIGVTDEGKGVDPLSAEGEQIEGFRRGQFSSSSSSSSASGPILSLTPALTSMDQFMAGQSPSPPSPPSLQSEDLDPTPNHPIKTTVEFSHNGKIVASVEISRFELFSTMHNWKITSPSITPFQHYLGPVNLRTKRENKSPLGSESGNFNTQSTSLSIQNRDIFDGSKKYMQISLNASK